jgi:hypothetical protein
LSAGEQGLEASAAYPASAPLSTEVPESIGMAGFLAWGSTLLRAFPDSSSGIVRIRYSLTVAGQRGILTLFPFNRALLGTAPDRIG